jgi:nitroreductase
MEVMEAVRKRRSIRAYQPTPVEQDSLDKILEAGCLAPSWANTQTWRFIVVRNVKAKTDLADAANPPGSRNNVVMKQAPVVIAACAELNRAGFREGKAVTDKEGYWFMFDVALALENMVLEAEELGVGTLYIGAFDAKKAGNVLSIPEGYVCVALLPLGYAAEQPEARLRKQLSEIVFYDKFGQR